MAIRFDSLGEGLIRTSDLLSHNADFTMAGWFRMTTDSNTYVTLFGIFSAGGEYDALETRNDGTTLLIVSNRTTFSQSSAILNLGLNTWYYVAFVRSGNSLTGYVITQAGSISSQTLGKNTSANSPSENTVGQWNDNTEVFNGRIMGLKFWSAALTQAELLNEMQSLLPRRTTNLYGFWPCFPGSGERVRDYSGNGRPWTESGTVSDEDPAPVSWGTIAGWVGQSGGAAADLVVDGTAHGQGAEHVTLTQVHSLVVQDATHGQGAEHVSLSQVHSLAVADANHGQSAEHVTLTQVHVLSVADGTHGQTAANVDLTQSHTLAVASAHHSQAVETLALVQVHVLDISATSHAHQAEQIELSAAIFLVIADGVHGHVVESLSLEQAHTLAVLPALHGQMAESLSLAQTHVLNLASPAHAHTAEQVVFQTGAPWDHTLQRGLRRGIDRRMER